MRIKTGYRVPNISTHPPPPRPFVLAIRVGTNRCLTQCQRNQRNLRPNAWGPWKKTCRDFNVILPIFDFFLFPPFLRFLSLWPRKREKPMGVPDGHQRRNNCSVYRQGRTASAITTTKSTPTTNKIKNNNIDYKMEIVFVTFCLVWPAMHARCRGEWPKVISLALTSTPFCLTRNSATGLWQCSQAKKNADRPSCNEKKS